MPYDGISAACLKCCLNGAANTLSSVVPDKRSADPGPITTGRSLTKTRSYEFALQPLPVVMGPGVRRDDTDYAGLIRHSMHRADLVAVEVTQIRNIEVDAGALADAGRIFARDAAGGDAGRMPCIDLLRRVGGKADGAAIRARRRLAIDRLRHREHAGLGDVEDAMAVDARRPHLERSEQAVVERLGLVKVVGADHDV